jgi:hypothetical protein
VRVRTNGEAAADAYCEVGEYSPESGLLKIWAGNGAAVARGGAGRGGRLQSAALSAC